MMQLTRAYPSVVCRVSQIDLAAVVGEIGKDNAQVYGASEETGAEATDRRRRNLGDVDWSYDRRLSDTETRNEAPSIDGSKVPIHAPNHEYHNPQDPKDTQLAGSPDATNFIADVESAASSQHTCATLHTTQHHIGSTLSSMKSGRNIQ
jgi:hypothetical protein